MKQKYDIFTKRILASFVAGFVFVSALSVYQRFLFRADSSGALDADLLILIISGLYVGIATSPISTVVVWLSAWFFYAVSMAITGKKKSSSCEFIVSILYSAILSVSACWFIERQYFFQIWHIWLLSGSLSGVICWFGWTSPKVQS
jgi:hypothetical protein